MMSESEASKKADGSSEEVTDEKVDNDLQYEDSVFHLKRPKDIRDGLGHGFGNIIKGALGGAALLVSAPIKGAYDGGHSEGGWGALKGFGAGLGIGVVGGVTMAVGGAVTGVVQIGRGIYNTPGSVSAMSEGKDWDEEKREWIIYNLREEADLILNMTEEQYLKSIKYQDPNDGKKGDAGADNDSRSNKPHKTVAETEYYDVLGVESHATSAEIKKAYYKKARDNHPDRHPDDPDAQAKFQAIGHAYQILSDEKLRANYDANGKDSVDGAPKLDPSTLYAMIFGSEKFVPLVGELKMASQMQAEESEASHPKLKKFRQKKREIQCALNLVQKLQPYIDSQENEEAFRATIAEELQELSASPFGSTLVATIGLSYYEAAAAELSTIEGISVGFTQATRSVSTSISIASEGIRAALIANEVNKAQKEKKLKADASVVASASASSTDAAASTTTTSSTGDAATASTTTEDDSKNSDQPGLTSVPLTSDMDAEAAAAAAEEIAAKERVERLSVHMFTVMWHLTDMDIRTTLASVCTKVTHDHSVSEKERHQRCKALKILGEFFISKGGSMAAGIGDMRNRLHAQMNGAAAANPEDAADSKQQDMDGSKGKVAGSGHKE